MIRNIVFLLFPHVHLLDLAGPAQVFYEASQLGGSKYQLSYCAGQQEISAEQQLTFTSLKKFSELSLRPGDLICIPGLDFVSFQLGKIDDTIMEVKSWLREQKRKGVFLSSICSGALILAKAGLLDRVQCTTHWKCLDYLKGTFPKVKVRENRLYCFDQGVFTSAGMTAGIDMALALVEQWDSPLVAAKVAQEMVINIRRADSVEQRNLFLDFKNHFNPDVYKAQEILAAQLSSSFTIDDLARTLNLSSRHLARLFKDHTGETIQAYRDRVRIDLGEQLLRHSEKSIKEISIECGFENSRQFSRLWKKYKNAAPLAFRKRPIQV
jgi:transcriptional regulator GlxA family with amidase domain